MWAPVRLTAPSSPQPVAVNPSPRNMLRPTCRLSATRAGPESLRRFAPVQSSWPPMWAPARLTAPSLPVPVAVNPPAEEHASWPTCRLSAARAGPESLRSFAPVQSRWPPMWAPAGGPRRPRRAGGGEPAAQKHVSVDLQAVGVQGGAGVVAQLRPGAVELAADVGAEQADRAAVTGSRWR